MNLLTNNPRNYKQGHYTIEIKEHENGIGIESTVHKKTKKKISPEVYRNQFANPITLNNFGNLPKTQ